MPPKAAVEVPKNMPLTSEQKLTVMSIQRKQLVKRVQINNIKEEVAVAINKLQKEIHDLENEQQVALKAITDANNIDPLESGLDDDLNIVPIKK
jgi:hypothetical protein